MKIEITYLLDGQDVTTSIPKRLVEDIQEIPKIGDPIHAEKHGLRETLLVKEVEPLQQVGDHTTCTVRIGKEAILVQMNTQGKYSIRPASYFRIANPGPHNSIADVLHSGFADLLRPNIQAEMKDSLEIKGEYIFDPTDAFVENFG
jgi:hypothetical protein